MSEAGTGTGKRSSRTWLIAIIAGVAVLAAVVTGGFIVLHGRSVHPSAGPASGSAHPVAGGPAGLTMVYLAPSVVFADASHGFILLNLCPTTGSARPEDPCDVWLGSTADGGSSWQAHRVPGMTFPRGHGNQVNPTEDIIAADATHVAFIDDEQNYRFSADGGEHWTTVEARATTEVATIAVNAYPTLVRTRGRGLGDFEVGLLTPEGTMARLSTQPGRIDHFQRATDGSIWFSGATFKDPRFAAYTSRDGGHTWVPVPGPADPALDDPTAKLLTYDGTTLYAVSARSRVWRTTDLGQHWQTVPLPFEPTGYQFASIGLDGSLLVADTESLAVGALRPAAGAFTSLGPANGFLADHRAGARYLSYSVSLVDGHVKLGDVVAHSADGTTWIEIPYPPAKS